MSWVRVPPEAADFSQKKSLPQVSLNCVVFLCVYLEGVSKFVYHVYTNTVQNKYDTTITTKHRSQACLKLSGDCLWG